MPAAPAALPVRRREIVGWAMFDFANSSYTTLIVTVAFSVYFTKLVVGGDAGRGDSLWGLAIALSNFVTMLAAPFVGAVADQLGRKKEFLFATYALCVGGTLALFFVEPGDVQLGLVLFVLSNLGFSMGENLAGAFLPEISTPRQSAGSRASVGALATSGAWAAWSLVGPSWPGASSWRTSRSCGRPGW